MLSAIINHRSEVQPRAGVIFSSVGVLAERVVSWSWEWDPRIRSLWRQCRSAGGERPFLPRFLPRNPGNFLKLLVRNSAFISLLVNRVLAVQTESVLLKKNSEMTWKIYIYTICWDHLYAYYWHRSTADTKWLLGSQLLYPSISPLSTPVPCVLLRSPLDHVLLPGARDV
jgi:hypothetical protein